MEKANFVTMFVAVPFSEVWNINSFGHCVDGGRFNIGHRDVNTVKAEIEGMMQKTKLKGKK